MKPEINLGLIGCGKWGINILRDLIKLNVKVEVAERNPINREKIKALGISALNSHKEFSSDIDGYIVAVQTIYHLDILKDISITGKPIFCEKPLTINPHEIKDLMSAKSKIFTMHKWRYHPVIEEMRKIISSGNYGKPVAIHSNRKQWHQPHTDVNAVWVLIPHDLSILLHLIGYIPNPVFCSATYRKNGQIQSLIAHLGHSPKCVIDVSECWIQNNRSLQVLMENGAMAMINPMSDELIIREGTPEENRQEKRIKVSNELPLETELKKFIGYLKGGEEPYTNILQEYELVKTIAKLHDMANS